MANKSWSTAVNGNWSDGTKWTPSAPTAPDDVFIGFGGATISAFTVTENIASVTVNSLTINGDATATGGIHPVTLALVGNTLTVATDLFLESAQSLITGVGTVSVGGKIHGAGTITAKAGLLNITGAGSLSSGLTFVIDTASPTTLKINMAGGATFNQPLTINNANQTLEIGPSAVTINNNSEAITEGTIKLNGGSVTDKQGITIDTNADLIGFGTITTGTGKFVDLEGRGTITASGGVLEIARATNLLAGGTQYHIANASGSVLKFGSTVGTAANIPTVTFDTSPPGGVGTLNLTTTTLADFHAIVDDFVVGTKIQVLNADHVTLMGNTTLNVFNASNVSLGAISLADSHTGAKFFVDTATDTITTDFPCYAHGTMILTDRGEVPIEELSIDDRVVTLSGEAKAIKWIGRRSYDGRFIAENRDVLPIRFTANSLADGVPRRDLDVSPKHAMFIDNVLIPAEELTNGVSIYQLDAVDSVAYFHIELDAHDVILAEGALSETFVDCDSRGIFHNAAEYAALYPDDLGPSWQFCAPRLERASEDLAEIRARLAARAGVAEGFGPPEALRGAIDRCDRLRVEGWVFDPAYPRQRVRLEVRYDGELIGHVVADRYRADLEKWGFLGDGHCSFRFTLPICPNPLSSHVVEIRRAVDGTPVPGSPILLPAASCFDAECHDGIARLLGNVAQTATKASDLDSVIGYLMTETETLLTARARLEGGVRADVTNLRDRWDGLVPTDVVRQTVPSLRPQALFIDELFPVAGEHAGANAALDHMRALMRIGFDVSFVASQDLGDRGRKAETLVGLGICPLMKPWYGSVEEVLRRHAGRIDLVYLHRASNAAAYGKLVRQYCPQAQQIYGVADLHHLRMQRQGAVEDRPELNQRARRMQLEELTAARLADVVITHSSAEAALLRAQIPGAAVAVVPWSVPLWTSTPDFAEREGVTFIGSFGHAPNVDAVRWLAQEILPLVRQQDPSICVRVVGSEMSEALRRLERPGLEFIGHVKDLEAVFRRTRLTVAPLRYGAGLKGKVIESLAAGVPCLGTSIAYEGMALPTALSDCIADTPAGLAAALVRLYHDPAAHARLAEAGRRYAMASYSEAAIDSLMQRVVAPVMRRWAGITEAVA